MGRVYELFRQAVGPAQPGPRATVSDVPLDEQGAEQRRVRDQFQKLIENGVEPSEAWVKAFGSPE